MSMRLPHSRTLGVVACLVAAFAAGCGGGDDAPPQPELLQITSSNQVAVAGATAANFSSLDSLRDSGDLGQAAPAQGSGIDGLTKRALGRAVGMASQTAPLATMSITESCAAGGSLTITIDDRDNNGAASPGDVLTAIFNDCRDIQSSLITGNFAVAITDYSEPVLSGLFTFGQLTVTDADGTFTANGQANMTYAISMDSAGTSTTRVDMKVAASGLVSSVSTASYRETFTYGAEFSAVWSDVSPAAASGYSTAALSGKVAFASLGKVLLATDPPIHIGWQEAEPESGVVLITGYQSRLRLSVLDTTMARLELDANNDGTFESVRDVTWDALLPY